MSVSIYSDIDDDGIVIIDPSFADCDPAVALQNLRTLNTSSNTNVTPDTTGRDTGQNIDFLLYEYDDLKMRRKAEVLRHSQNKHIRSKKSSYSEIAKGNGSFRNVSNYRIKQLVENNNCQNQIEFLNKATFSGVRGDNTVLYLDENIPFYSTI
jgi:hypothetical protein